MNVKRAIEKIKKEKGKRKKEMMTDTGLHDVNNPFYKLKIDLYRYCNNI